MFKKLIFFFLSFSLFFIFFSCSTNYAEVSFFNVSSFNVDIFKNINPSLLDKSTRPIATIPAGSEVKLKLPPSNDQWIGDVFYIHYHVQLADSFSSGTGAPLYVKAKRDISNISFVITGGKSYTKQISQPETGKLKFINGYIKVQNVGHKSIQVANGDSYLKKLGTQESNLTSGSFGFYEFEIPAILENISVSSLKFFVIDNGKILEAPQFVMERGKIYNFQCDASYVTGPSVQNISY